MNEKITIALAALIHRIGREAVKQAQTLARQCDCELKRVRRSRNWQVTGEAINVQSFTQSLKTEQLTPQRGTINDGQFRYLIQKIETALLSHADKLEPLAEKLTRLIIQNPNVTLAELMHLTDCTMTEARAARFHAEAW